MSPSSEIWPDRTPTQPTLIEVVCDDVGCEVGIVVAIDTKMAAQMQRAYQWECAGCGDHANRFWHRSQGATPEIVIADLHRHVRDECREKRAA